MQDHEGEITVKVDGIAASMMFYIALFADKVEALDVSRFLIHRADGYVDNEDQKAELKTINTQIRAKLEKRINNDIFKQATGVSYDEIFDENNRKDVWIGAKEAKKMGLVDKITRLEPREIAAMNETILAFTESSQGSEDTRGSEGEKQTNIINNKNLRKMTKAELKAQHPDLYNEIYGEGLSEGKKLEGIRISTWMAYLDYDKDNVIASVKSGKEFTSADAAEMAVKITAKATLTKIEADKTEKIATEITDDKTAQQKENEATENELLTKGKEHVKNLIS